MASKVNGRRKHAQASNSLGVVEPLDPLSELELDPRNPRLGLEKEVPQAKLIELMLRRFKIEDVADSIIASGWQPFDPLVGYRTKKKKVVLREGNRRLTALKLLLEPALAPEEYRSSWAERSASLSPAQRAAIRKVDVNVVEDADAPAVEAYVGFRHVSGALAWPPQQKAAFIADLIERLGWTYAEIAERLGSYPRHVEKLFVAFRVAAQARAERVPGAERITIGVLLRALQTQGVRTYLGVDYPDDPRKSKRPIPASKEDELADFVRWVFGTDDIVPVLRDSRELTRFGRVLGSKEAVRYLRSHPRPSLDRAWMKSGGQTDTLVDSLAAAADRLEDSVPQTPGYARQQTPGAAEVRDAIEKCAGFLALILRDYPDIRESFCSDK